MKTVTLFGKHQVEDKYPDVSGGLTECVAIPGGGCSVEVRHVMKVRNVVVLCCTGEGSVEGEACFLIPEQAEKIADSLRYHAQQAREKR